MSQYPRYLPAEIREAPVYYNTVPYDIRPPLYNNNTATFGYLPNQRDLEYDKDMLYIYSKYRPTISVMKKIPPSRSPTEEIVYYMKEVMYFDREVEKSKELLAQQSNIRLVDLFNFFDTNHTGQVVIQELKEGLTNFFDFVPKEEDLRMLVIRYSRDGNGRLS